MEITTYAGNTKVVGRITMKTDHIGILVSLQSSPISLRVPSPLLSRERFAPAVLLGSYPQLTSNRVVTSVGFDVLS